MSTGEVQTFTDIEYFPTSLLGFLSAQLISRTLEPPLCRNLASETSTSIPRLSELNLTPQSPGSWQRLNPHLASGNFE